MAMLLLVMPVLIERGKAAVISQYTAAIGGAQEKSTQSSSNEVHTYEVVSIKPNKAGTLSAGGTRVLPDGFEYMNIPFSIFVKGAYGLNLDSQVAGLPGWAREENYDIVAKVDAETAEKWKKLSRKERREEEQPMKQSILADRCQFRAHEETRELPVYDLVIAKGGLNMKEAPPNETPMVMMSGDQMTVHAMKIDTIASTFGGTVGRMIVDKTGLVDKKFDFELKWTPDDRPPADDSEPSLFTALEEQLGLKLVSAKGPVEVLIIDHIERPSPN
jgi:uncharacterized protein (TIGR03435 family)